MCQRVLDAWSTFAYMSYNKHNTAIVDEATEMSNFQAQPHILLHAIITSTKSSFSRDPGINDTIEWLHTKSKELPIGDERTKVHCLHTWLSKAFDTYDVLVQKHAFPTHFASNEFMFPGYYKRWLSEITFGTALTAPLFTKYVQKGLDPRLYLIRGTQRALAGLPTQALAVSVTLEP